MDYATLEHHLVGLLKQIDPDTNFKSDIIGFFGQTAKFHGCKQINTSCQAVVVVGNKHKDTHMCSTSYWWLKIYLWIKATIGFILRKLSTIIQLITWNIGVHLSSSITRKNVYVCVCVYDNLLTVYLCQINSQGISRCVATSEDTPKYHAMSLHPKSHSCKAYILTM